MWTPCVRSQTLTKSSCLREPPQSCSLSDPSPFSHLSISSTLLLPSPLYHIKAPCHHHQHHHLYFHHSPTSTLNTGPFVNPVWDMAHDVWTLETWRRQMLVIFHGFNWTCSLMICTCRSDAVNVLSTPAAMVKIFLLELRNDSLTFFIMFFNSTIHSMIFDLWSNT